MSIPEGKKAALTAPPTNTSRPITSFADAIRVKPLEGADNQFEATIPWDWCGGLQAHGGFTVSLIFSTVRTFFLQKYPDSPQPDPITSDIHFIRPVPLGRVILTIKEQSHARRYSTVHVTLCGPNGITCTSALVIQGNLATERGHSNNAVPPVMLPEEIPDRERDCYNAFTPPWLIKMMPVIHKWHILWRKGPNQQALSRKGPGFLNTKEQWLKWKDPLQKIDILSLGVLSDMFLPGPVNYDPDMADLQKYLFPTLSLSLEIKKDPNNAEWLLMDIETCKIQNGRWDTHVRILDESGDLVALSKSVSTMTAIDRIKTGKAKIGDDTSKL